PEGLGAGPQRLLGFVERWPPRVLDMVEAERRPAPRQLARRGADVADESGMLAYGDLDGEGQLEQLGDDRCRLQRPRIGARDQPPHALSPQLLRQASGLAASLLRQGRIRDPRI